jgi:hypothetical protein
MFWLQRFTSCRAGWPATVVGCVALIVASHRAEAVALPANLSPVNAFAEVITTDGEGVNLGFNGIPEDQGSALPVYAVFTMNQQAGIVIMNSDNGFQTVFGYENASAGASIDSYLGPASPLTLAVVTAFPFFANLPQQLDPTISLSAHASNNNPYGLSLGGASATAFLNYQFELVPSPLDTNLPSETVPVDMLGGISGSGQGTFGINVVNDQTDQTVFDMSGVPGAVEFIDPTLEIEEGVVYDVSYAAQVTVSGNGSANLEIDPAIFIDPSFGDAPQFAIAFSSGLAPPPNEVPEPTSFYVFGLGLIVLGTIRRRIMTQQKLECCHATR